MPTPIPPKSDLCPECHEKLWAEWDVLEGVYYLCQKCGFRIAAHN